MTELSDRISGNNRSFSELINYRLFNYGMQLAVRTFSITNVLELIQRKQQTYFPSPLSLQLTKATTVLCSTLVPPELPINVTNIAAEEKQT